VQKAIDRKSISMDVRVFGSSAASTQDQMCRKEKGKLVKVAKGASKINVTLDNDSMVTFVLVDCMNLNATDYMLCYKME